MYQPMSSKDMSYILDYHTFIVNCVRGVEIDAAKLDRKSSFRVRNVFSPSCSLLVSGLSRMRILDKTCLLSVRMFTQAEAQPPPLPLPLPPREIPFLL